MKKTILAIALCLAACLPAAAQNPAQALPGPAVSGSMEYNALPQAARAFISQLFPDGKVVRVENDYADREYEVKMADGYEITFNYQGQWKEIDAPDGATLPRSAVPVLVPEQVVVATFSGDALLGGGIVDGIEEIEVIPEGYAVEYRTGKVGTAKARVRASDGAIILPSKEKKKAVKKAAKRYHKAKKRAAHRH